MLKIYKNNVQWCDIIAIDYNNYSIVKYTILKVIK